MREVVGISGKPITIESILRAYCIESEFDNYLSRCMEECGIPSDLMDDYGEAVLFAWQNQQQAEIMKGYSTQTVIEGAQMIKAFEQQNERLIKIRSAMMTTKRGQMQLEAIPAGIDDRVSTIPMPLLEAFQHFVA